MSSDYTTSPAPSTNTSYSDDFGNQDRRSGASRQLPSAAAYHRALAELAASARASQQANDVADYQQGRTEAPGSGRAATFRHAGSEVTASSSGHGQHSTADNHDYLLTAPRVSISPPERVRFHTAFIIAFLALSVIYTRILIKKYLPLLRLIHNHLCNLLFYPSSYCLQSLFFFVQKKIICF